MSWPPGEVSLERESSQGTLPNRAALQAPQCGAVGKCSPGRKTNTKPGYFLLYFSYRSFAIQKGIEERAIIKPLMYC